MKANLARSALDESFAVNTENHRHGLAAGGKSETLARIALFRSLDAGAIAELDRQCSWRQYPRNDWIVGHHELSNDVFFIFSGSVRLKIPSTSGREVVFRDLNAGDFFGEVSAIDGQPRASGIQAVTDVVIARMPASVFRKALHSHPDVCDQVLAGLADKIRVLVNRVSEFSTLDVRHRIYAELLRLSRPRPGAGNNRAVISPPPVHAAIAARISTRREAVAREMKALERAGLLERRRGALLLTDTRRLQCMVERVDVECTEDEMTGRDRPAIRQA